MLNKETLLLIHMQQNMVKKIFKIEIPTNRKPTQFPEDRKQRETRSSDEEYISYLFIIRTRLSPHALKLRASNLILSGKTNF